MIRILFLIAGFSIYVPVICQPCQDYSCDSTVVRTILDINGLQNIPVDSISRTDSTGRIDLLRLIGEYANKNIPSKLTTIPDAIGSLTNLTYLDLTFNQISIIPETIGNLTNLTRLWLPYNQISVISDTIGNLTNLNALYIYYNQISVIPDAIGSLTNLTALNISNNQISVIPYTMGNLTNLTQLWLSNNQISVIPDVIGSLNNLTWLSLINNRICNVSAIIANWADTYDPGWRDSQDCNTIVIDIENQAGTKSTFSLSQNTPNPFNTATTFSLQLPESSPVKLQVYNHQGRLITTLVNEQKPPGPHSVTWNAANMHSGVYYFQLQADGKTVIKKGILLE